MPCIPYIGSICFKNTAHNTIVHDDTYMEAPVSCQIRRNAGALCQDSMTKEEEQAAPASVKYPW